MKTICNCHEDPEILALVETLVGEALARESKTNCIISLHAQYFMAARVLGAKIAILLGDAHASGLNEDHCTAVMPPKRAVEILLRATTDEERSRNATAADRK